MQLVKSRLNDKEGTLEILQDVMKQDWGHSKKNAPTDPNLEKIRGDPRFKKLVA